MSSIFLISFIAFDSFAGDCTNVAAPDANTCSCTDGSTAQSSTRRTTVNGVVLSTSNVVQCENASDTTCNGTANSNLTNGIPDSSSPQYFKNTSGLGYYKCDFVASIAVGGGFSNAQTYSPPPNAPTGLNASVVSSTQIDLSWTDNSSDETGFKIFRNGTELTPSPKVAAGIATFNDTGLTCNTSYTYTVKATNGSDSSAAATTPASTTTSACVVPPPTAPTGLSATAASATQINLSWTDASSDETGFKIFKDGTLLNTTAAGATSYNATGLTCNTAYTFTVKATNANGDSTAATTPATTTTSACQVVSAPIFNFKQPAVIYSEGINVTK